MGDLSAVVIGAGVDGLTAAALLVRSGLSVTVLEAAEEIGGRARPVAFQPGWRVSLAPETLPPLEPHLLWESGIDLDELAIVPRPSSVSIAPDGSVLARFLDEEEDRRALGGAVPGDGPQMPLFEALMMRGARLVGALQRAGPVQAGTARAFTRRSRSIEAALARLEPGAAHEAVRLLAGSARSLLDRYFTDDRLKAHLAGPALTGSGLGPMAPGTAAGLIAPWIGAALAPPRTGAVLQGGLQSLIEAIGRATAASGANVRVRSPVRELTLRHDRVSGVVLDTGEAIPADLVLSSLETRATLALLEAGPLREALLAGLPAPAVAAVALRAAFALDRRPRWTGLPVPLQRHSGPVMLAPSLDGLERASDAARAGAIPETPWAELTVASDHDDGLAPHGKALLTATVLPLPAAPPGGWSAEERARVLDRLMMRIETVARGFTASVEARALLVEQARALAEGSPFRLMTEQSPRLAAGGRRTLRNLYLCGADQGGRLMPLGTAGLLAGRQVLADLSGLRAA